MEAGIEATRIQSVSFVTFLGGQLDLDQSVAYKRSTRKPSERRPKLESGGKRSQVKLTRLDAPRPRFWSRDGRDRTGLLNDLGACVRSIRCLA